MMYRIAGRDCVLRMHLGMRIASPRFAWATCDLSESQKEASSLPMGTSPEDMAQKAKIALSDTQRV